MIDVLGIPARKIERIYYHADQQFFRPSGSPVEPNLLCAAGQLLRDYECLIEAVRDLPVKVQIAAGSPWIDHSLKPQGALPENVTWGKLGRFELSGVVAWWLWLTVHVLFLVEFRRRLAVLFEWGWAYFTWQRRSRVILEVPQELAPKAVSLASRRLLKTGT